MELGLRLICPKISKEEVEVGHRIIAPQKSNRESRKRREQAGTVVRSLVR